MNPRRLIKNFLNELSSTGLIELEETESTFVVHFRDTPKKKSSPPTEDFDFDAIYKAYPLKKGKAKGMAKLKKLIKTKEDYERIKNAVMAYANAVRGSDPRYIQHFSTFMNGTWEDYELLPAEPLSADSAETDDYVLILQTVGLHLKFQTHMDRIKEVFPEYEQFRAFLSKHKEFFNRTHDAEKDREHFRAVLTKVIKGEIGVRD